MYKKILLTVSLCASLLQVGAVGTEKSNNIKNDDGFTTIVFDRANSPVPYRIPAITETRKGTLLAACDFRLSHTDVGWNNRNGLWQINIVMKTSKDFGKTWSDTVCVARGNEHAADPIRTAFGDPSIIADRTSVWRVRVPTKQQPVRTHSMLTSSTVLMVVRHGTMEQILPR